MSGPAPHGADASAPAPHGAGPMGLALQAARQAAALDEVPVGAVVTDEKGHVLAVCGNRMRTRRDASAHAEMLALQEAARVMGQERLTGCDLWVTLEPCAMCASAAGLFRVRRIVFGAYDAKGGGIVHGPRIFDASSLGHRPEIIGGVQESESAALLLAFFRMLRESN
jgi:tRNA(adenine34) deaminase